MNIVAVQDSWLYPFVHAAFLSTLFLILISLEGCDSYFEVNLSFKFYKLLQIKQLPCIKQYVPGQGLNTTCIITMANNLTDMIFNIKFDINLQEAAEY